MTTEKTVNHTKISLVRDDITLIDVDAFVFYARPDLQLGTGIGNAIAVRGGPKIQEALDKLDKPEVGQVLVSEAGKLKAKNIIHAVGPVFQEDDTEGKLRTTAQNVLETAEKHGVEKLALPAMGSGFYGVAPDMCAKVTLAVVNQHVKGQTKLKEVFFCLPDPRDMMPFQARLEALT
ncbi:MAG: macro domain-containing protein [Deltaproteobacteria bacterium]|nr:macro domain-containing protein [Deltaproteobacteria bacterium]MBW1871373.1 macro domain-containing protein [Deltaproteobacteria bacterium]